MTLKEIAIEAFEALGEPSDLDFWSVRPTTGSDGTVNTTSLGWKRLVDAINAGCMALSAWKWPNGRTVKMRHVEDTTVMRMSARSGAVTSVSTTGCVFASVSSATNEFLGRLLVGQTSGATGLVLYSAAGATTTLVLTKVSGTFTEGETAKLYRRDWQFAVGTDPRTTDGIPYVAAQGRPIEVVQVVDLASDAVLEETTRQERFLSAAATVGTPTGMYRVPQGFVVDAWPTDGLDFVVRYFRGPRLLAVSDGDVEPELPVQFHGGVVLWVVWWGLRRGQESDDAYAVKRDLEDFMARTRTEVDFQDELVSGQVKMYPQGK